MLIYNYSTSVYICLIEAFNTMDLKSVCQERVELVNKTEACQKLIPRLRKEKVRQDHWSNSLNTLL